MKLTFLGTGTSTGVPYIGCHCEVCKSTDPRDKRLRSSALLQVKGKAILFDCGPDFRQQALRENIEKLDAVLLTHKHIDHTFGLDDLRPFGRVKIYGNEETIQFVRHSFSYCFNNDYKGLPQLDVNAISENPFFIDDLEITPILIWHYKLPAFGYRIGNLAYLTDYKTIDDDRLEKLKNLNVLVVDALRWEPHFSHANIEEALSLAEKIKPKSTYFIHMSHTVGLHEKIQKRLPPNVFFAYDGLEIEIED